MKIEFKKWLENIEYSNIHSPYDLNSFKNSESVVTFIYEIEKNTVYCTNGKVLHTSLETYVEHKLNTYLSPSNKIYGRIAKIKNDVLFIFFNDKTNFKQYVNDIFGNIIHNMPIFKNKNFKYYEKSAFNDEVTKIKPNINNNIYFQWFNENEIENHSDELSVQSYYDCPEIDYQNLMTKLHTGTAEEKNNIALRICNLKIDPKKCPIVAKQVEALKARCNCKKQIDYKKEYETLLANAKRRESW